MHVIGITSLIFEKHFRFYIKCNGNYCFHELMPMNSKRFGNSYMPVSWAEKLGKFCCFFFFFFNNGLALLKLWTFKHFSSIVGIYLRIMYLFRLVFVESLLGVRLCQR